jgi:hypothetical protein
MNLQRRTLIVIAAAALAACGGGVSEDAAMATSSATYLVTFRTDWIRAAFPTNFPTDRHFSGLVGATHAEGLQLWAEGEPASLGIQNMAERGQKAALLDEVERAMRTGLADAPLNGGGIAATEAEVTLEFTVTQSHPLVTLVAMVAPSPDWFVGVHNLPLFVSNQWQAKVTVPLAVYDAGTDDGLSFESADAAAVPHVAIRTLTSAAGDTDFHDGLHRTTGSTVGSFTFERLR